MKKIFLIAITLFLSACSSHYETTTQVDDKAYLQLSGSLAGAQLVLDQQPAINLDGVASYTEKDETVIKFVVATGNHLVEIHKNGETLVKRNIFVTNGNTFEIRIP
ncbi:hypothetical protein [Shewanella sp.]|jgi:uncharacterized lipoprotein YajG|uniref:hypothetical protein n=1 Tax=Shewanella sp. TaxID=50422 RepID=UPI003D137118